MVNPALLVQVQQLDHSQLLELRDAIDARLGDEEPSEAMLAIVRARLVKKGPGPDASAITLDEFERRLAARRTA